MRFLKFQHYPNLLLILSLLLTSTCFSQTEVTDSDKREVYEQIENTKKYGFLGCQTFDKWQTYYDVLADHCETDLSVYGFSIYEKHTMSGKKYGLIRNNDTITKARFDEIGCSYRCGIIVTSGNKSGIVDTSGKLIVPIEYDDLASFDFKTGFVKKNNKFALMSYSGKLLTGFIFDYFGYFIDDVALVQVGEKLGYINRIGQFIVPLQFFNTPSNFFHGFAKIYSNKWNSIGIGQRVENLKVTNVEAGYSEKIPTLINKNGVKVFTGESGDEIYISENGYAIIIRFSNAGGAQIYTHMLIDNTGKIIIPFSENLSILRFMKKLILVKSRHSKLFGLYGYDGKAILKPSFTTISGFEYKNGELARAYFDENTFMYIDHTGKCQAFDGIACPPVE